uniref:G_PROTEIN_RECEP_F1_2 domain-containing protein n=1 Tax=Steinernema glaseri TaxID=37863 RepID=A0A1I7Y926_9BILA
MACSAILGSLVTMHALIAWRSLNFIPGDFAIQPNENLFALCHPDLCAIQAISYIVATMGSEAEIYFTTRYTIPPQFADCPKEYRHEADDKYLLCDVGPDQDYCVLLKDLHDAKEFRTFFLAFVPFILATIAIICNVFFVACGGVLFANQQVGSKKRYAFLLSRSISTLMALILFYIVMIFWKTGGFQYSSATIFLLMGCLTFLTLTGTYLAMTSLLYIAIAQPLWYKQKVTLTKCLVIIAIIWLIAVAFSVCVGIFGATLFYHDSAPFYCDFRTCQRPIAIVVVIVLSICYVSVMVFYVSMLIRMRIRYASRLEVGTRNTIVSITTGKDSNIRAMNRLSLNLAVFAISKCPILIVSIVALANLEHLASLGNGYKNACKTYLNGSLYLQVELLASIAAIVWLTGMIMDPVINIACDQRFCKMIKMIPASIGYAVNRCCRRGREVVRTCEVQEGSDSEEF